MRGPPTPISACPLKRLEVRDGVSSKSYNSVSPMSVFTLTLEGERPIDAETGSLVLIVHHGHQLLLSIRLTDLLKSAHEVTDITSIDKQMLRLSIKVPGRSYMVIADFEEQRDFGVAVCMLKKSNFIINEPVNSPCFRSHSILPPVTSLDANITSGIARRLSSITPVREMHPPIYASSAMNETSHSFMDMLNSPLSISDAAFSPAQTPDTNQLYPQRMSSMPDYYHQSPMMVSAPIMTSQPNPYSLYLGRNTDSLYKPRVSSPLKNSLNFGEFSPNQSSREFESASSQRNEYTPVGVQSLNPDSRSEVGFPSSLSPSPFILNSPGHQIMTENGFIRSSSDPSSRSEPVGNIHRAESQPLESQCDQDFRTLMPQPRALPFVSERKEEVQSNLTSHRTMSSQSLLKHMASMPVKKSSPRKAGLPRGAATPKVLSAKETNTPRKAVTPDIPTAKISSPLKSISPIETSNLKISSPRKAKPRTRIVTLRIPSLMMFPPKEHPMSTKQPVSAKQPAPTKRPTPAKNPSAKKSTPSKKSTPLIVPIPAQKAIPVKRPTPAKKQTPAKKPTPVRRPNPTKKPTLAENPTPLKKLASANESTPAKKPKGTKASTPAKKLTPAKKPSPAKAPPLEQGKPTTVFPKKRPAPVTPMLEGFGGGRSSKRVRTSTPAQSTCATTTTAISVKTQCSMPKLPPKAALSPPIQVGIFEETLHSGCSSSQPELPPTPDNSPEVQALVIEASVLSELNQITAKLFGQYEADVAGGSDETASAQFYLDQIFEVRRDFWYSKLSQQDVTGIQV